MARKTIDTMDRQEILKLRDLPIEGVAERLGLRVVRHKALCPFHDDHHASLSFSRGRNSFKCFVCGASGGTIDLVMRCLRMDFREACRWLASENNVILTDRRPRDTASEAPRPFDASRYVRFFAHPQLTPQARRFLFDERRLNPKVVEWLRIGSWRDHQGTNWLQTPYYDRGGRLIGIQNRNLDYGRKALPEEGSVRFRFPYGSCCTIYNLPVINLLEPYEPLYITEGCSDCWAMLSSGHKAIAIPSATLLKPSDMKRLTDLEEELGTRFHMYPDRDAPGERLFMQLKQFLPRLEHHQLPPDCKDFSDFYLKQRKEAGNG